MSGTHRFDSSILREYDVRGIVGETLTVADAQALGRAFATMVTAQQGTRVVVGRDGRPSSVVLEAALVEGLAAAGVDVIRIGLGPTPMLYFAVHELGADGGIMITGSHNPPEYNGFKMVLGKAALYGKDIQRLGEIAATGAWTEGEGTVTDTPVEDAYVARLLADYDGDSEHPLSVAWDNGNGSGGNVMVRLCAALPGRHTMLNENIDGSFPAHHPDPTVPENLLQLQDTVRAMGCHIGIAFDGDGDRIGVVDDRGNILWGDQLMVLLARDVLRKSPGSTIIADVKASQVLFDEIAEAGGAPLMWRTGHSLIKAKMAEIDAPLAGEMSGHIFFNDRYYGYDDALYAAVRTIGVVSRLGRKLSDVCAELPRVVNTPELRFDCPEDRKFKVIDEVRERLRETGAEVNDIDGVRVRTLDGWWLLRASNTQAVLVARCEALHAEGMERLKVALTGQLRASGITPPAF